MILASFFFFFDRQFIFTEEQAFLLALSYIPGLFHKVVCGPLSLSVCAALSYEGKRAGSAYFDSHRLVVM